MQGFDELRAFVADGEFTVPGVLMHDGESHQVSGIFSRRWKRKDVDGQLTTDLPLETVSYQIPLSQIPDVPRNEYTGFRFIIEGAERSVRYVSGSDPVAFYLLIPSDEGGGGDGEMEL